MLDLKIVLLFGFCVGVLFVNWYNNFTLLYATILLYATTSLLERPIQAWIEKYFLLKQPVYSAQRQEHDKRRNMTYPEPIANSWYHLCDTHELPHGKVMEVRALGQTFVLWRTEEGQPVCQDAYCIHVGANLAVGGQIKDNCIQCPFHHWKFAADGTVKEIPYLEKPHECMVNRKLKTYECIDWCGLVFVYFHADGKTSESQGFPMPKFVPEELKRDNWEKHLSWDLGFKTLTPVDWVDQSGDHAHFNTLHAEFLIPWTMIPIPKWFKETFLPLGITHQLKTYLGDDKEWAEIVNKTGWGEVNKNYIFFTDFAGITWKGKPVQSSLSQTTELFVGPAMMVFNIPFTIGTFKVFVSTTPVEGGSIMKVRTWIDGRTASSYWKKWIAWVLSGISASQLMSDIDIMCNKIRQRKPLLVKGDGPYNRTNTWAHQFYSESSSKVSSCAYKNDW